MSDGLKISPACQKSNSPKYREGGKRRAVPKRDIKVQKESWNCFSRFCGQFFKATKKKPFISKAEDVYTHEIHRSFNLC
jgi:hypothetical protein